MQDVLATERAAWDALIEGSEATRKFYERSLAEDAVMIFPSGMSVRGKTDILASFGTVPWSSCRLEEAQVLELTKSSYVVVYKVTAKRNQEVYRALISSTYRIVDGIPQLVVHQQSPY